ncbi:Kinesin-like protein KIN-12E [Linum perenne]
MPFNYEAAASAIKSRFGFHERSTSETVPTTPFLLNSVSRDEFASGKPLVAASAARRIVDWDDESGSDNNGLEIGDGSSFWKENNIQVIIRMRPLSGSEISQQGQKKCVRRDSSQMITWTGPPESRFTFDLVADENVGQEQMFKAAGMPMVDNCMGGYNSCMFAYGQTGSGKTYTMLGDIEGGTRRHSVHSGMTPRVFEYLFSRIQKEKDVRHEEKLKFICKCSFLEIYNEQILDLLDPSSNNLQIREDVKKGVYVDNLKEVEVSTARDVIQQLIEGSTNRKVAATNMNHASSRSHSVFTCIIESKWESQGVTHHRFARLNLVDLAGSERQKSSGAEGERLKEATNINKSLSTLGLVIMNLVSISNGKALHVPYRDSKLTFLLQDSLGGNAKTIIVANISPALCNSLETLGTLKFAQRAKFIKNNAIVNEDTSGDVIGMRMQIQQLKKEVTHLRSLVNDGTGGFSGIDASGVSISGSPAAFKWEGLQGSCSPFVSDKRLSQKKDYDVALIGAFKREKDKDLAVKALTAENQAVMKLAKQREDEIQGLKMRLRFREAGIKRLESVAAGKISAETHLLQEKEEHLKEIQLLRTQVDRNQEVTRFAMENLKLKEEIRRHVCSFLDCPLAYHFFLCYFCGLKSSCEEGEKETMSEQITVLQNKLLEALDWKLMHESDTLFAQKENSNKGKEEDSDHFKLCEEPGSPWRSSMQEENEFLRMQAIQNQSEIDTLHKQLNFCLEERERLQRDVSDLALKLDEARRDVMEAKINPTSINTEGGNDQLELKTMVDAIAAATQREAELSTENSEVRAMLETHIQENGELQSKLKALIDEKNSLIEMYERAASESKYKGLDTESARENDMDIDNTSGFDCVKPNETESSKTALENLEHQLMEMHEENDRLLGLYETAMHERDELKRMLSCLEKHSDKIEAGHDCQEKLVEVDIGECPESDNSLTHSDAEQLKTAEPEHGQEHMEIKAPKLEEGTSHGELGTVSDEENMMHDFGGFKIPDLNSVKIKLETAQEKLSDSSKILTVFNSLEKAFSEFDKVSREVETKEKQLQAKQMELKSIERLSAELQHRKSVTDNKFSALRCSLSSFSSSLEYFDKQEAHLAEKQEAFASLQVQKIELEAATVKANQSKAELRNSISALRSKLDEENRRQENEKVILFAIDSNIEKKEDAPLQRNWQLAGKATELLKSEEKKTKLQTELKSLEKLTSSTRKEIEELSKKLRKIENEMQSLELEMDTSRKTREELKHAHDHIVKEKESLIKTIDSMIVEYQQQVFAADLADAEKKIVEDEAVVELGRTEELRAKKLAVAEDVAKLLGDTNSCFVSQKIEAELKGIEASVMEAKSLLTGDENSCQV